MPPEPSVTSACEGPRLCTLRYSSALLPKSFERPGPKSVSPATYCSGVEVVVWRRWIVDMRSPYWRSHTVRLSCGKQLGFPVVFTDSTSELLSGWHFKPTSHRQNDAELCVAAHHSRVALGRFFERVGFDHRTHAGQLGESKRVLGICRRSGSPTLNRPISKNELWRCDFNGVKSCTDHHELPVRPQAVDQFGHCLRVWGRR